MAQNSRTTDVLLCREPVRVQLPPAVVQALAELAKHRKCRRTPLAAISGRGGHGSGALPILQLSIKSVDLHTRGHTYQTYIPDLHTRPTNLPDLHTRPTNLPDLHTRPTYHRPTYQRPILQMLYVPTVIHYISLTGC